MYEALTLAFRLVKLVISHACDAGKCFDAIKGGW